MTSDRHDENPEADEVLDLPLVDDQPAAPEREQTAMEMMGAPNRASDSARRTVLWISLAFASVMFTMTLGVIYLYGFDVLTLFTTMILGFVLYALLGAVRYKGEDPMAQFDPPARPKRRWFGGGKA